MPYRTYRPYNLHAPQNLQAPSPVSALRDWSKNIGGGGRGAGAFGNVVDKKHMAHPFPSAQEWLTHPLSKDGNCVPIP